MYDYYEASSDRTDIPNGWDSHDVGTPAHFHAGIELIFVLDGTVTGDVNGQQMTVQPGELLINDCYTVHKYDYRPVHALVVIIPLDSVPMLKDMLEEKHFTEPITPDDNDHTIERLMRMIIEFKEHPEMTKGLSQALLSYLTENVGMTAFGTVGSYSFLRDVLTYLSAHYRERLSMEQLATRFEYSAQRFQSLFKECIGETIQQYVNGLRVDQAAHLLLATEKTITDIAAESGFSSVKALEIAFRDEFNMSPAEFVKSKKQQ